MTRILYGLSGEGSGHSSRSKQMARHLESLGHEVWLASYDRGYRNLKDEFNVFEIEGLAIASADNKVSNIKTVTKNVKRLKKGWLRLRALKNEMFKIFEPEVVITDFEPMTAYLAHHYDIPLMTIDNQHRMRYMTYECPPGHQFDQKMTKSIIRAMVPRPDLSLVTTFYEGQVTNDRTLLFPPILRDEVIAMQPSDEGHILVYLTSGYDTLLSQLKKFTHERFIVYGYDRRDQEDNLIFKLPSKQGFLDDLATSQAVIATAGFTLISEALYLKKPYLAMPMEGQYEQQLNGFWLEQLGLGRNAPEINEDVIGAFLYRLPEFNDVLESHESEGNMKIQAKLDELMQNNGQQLKEFHHRRKRKKWAGQIEEPVVDSEAT